MTAKKTSAKSKIKKTKTKKKTKSKTINNKKTKVVKIAVAKKTVDWQYNAAPESSKSVNIKERYKLFIGGHFVDPKSGEYMATINPATEKVLAEIAVAGAEDVDNAVAAAQSAFPGWSNLKPSERGRYLFRIARILQERSKEFAILETLDGGKPIKESRDVDIPLAANHFFYNAGWADKLEYLYPGKKVAPLGVCGQIIPWNFPLLMAAWKIAPALTTGNCVVLKPAEQTSLTALLLAEVIQEAELPPGVVNIITGAGATGEKIVGHPGIQKIAFTGSTEVGKMIAKTAAKSDKKVSLELGGKSANIIFADAAIDQAVEGVVSGIFFNQGHVCCAGSRLLVEESVYPEVIRKLKKRMAQLRVGDPMDKNTDIGAINSKEQWDKICGLVKQGQDEGGEFYLSPTKLPAQGYFHAPCFFSGQGASATISRVEVFGPVLSIMTFRTPDEAITKANDTEYGLAAGIWSEKGAKIHYVAQKLKAGIIWANTYNKFDAAAPFGGMAESGWGREGGRHGLLPYLEVQS